MIAEYMRDGARSLPAHPSPLQVTAIRIWHCKYKSLSGLSNYENLKTLVIATYPDTDLEPLASLSNLDYLSITHLPNVSDLAPLGHLQRLSTIRLSTLPSWDSSGKQTTVHSLEPLAELPALTHLELFGVLPEDGSLQALENCRALESIRVSKYPPLEVDRFYRKTGLADSFAPSPSVPAWT
jgi:Leucine-rich repeat (LRR) protein